MVECNTDECPLSLAGRKAGNGAKLTGGRLQFDWKIPAPIGRYFWEHVRSMFRAKLDPSKSPNIGIKLKIRTDSAVGSLLDAFSQPGLG